MTSWSRSLLVVAIVSALPLIGIALLAPRRAAMARHLTRFVPVAIGALLGAALLHLVPEALARGGVGGGAVVAAWVAVGVAGFALLDRWLHGRVGVAGVVGAGGGQVVLGVGTSEARLRDLVPLLVAGDALHNAVDGALIAAAYLDEPTLGIVTGLAVALHELPRELATFALLVGAGMSVRRAVAINVGTAALAAASAVSTLVMGQGTSHAGATFLAVGAGNFLYLGGALAWSQLRFDGSRREGVTRLLLVAVGVLFTLLGRHSH